VTTQPTPDEWITDELPDFREHGFHNQQKHIRFRLSDGTEHQDIYQGWGIFGTGKGYDWMAGDPHVTAWRPL